MSSTLKFRLSIGVLMLSLVIYLWTGGFVLNGYINPGSINIRMGLLTILFTAVFDVQAKGNRRFLYISILLALLSMLAPVKTIFYFLLVVSVAGFLEYFIGRMNALPLLAAIVMSPALSYAIGVFSFPIRLKMTQCAGWMLSMVAPATKVSGNMIVYDGAEFSVDPACMGLHMLITALLSVLVLTGIYQKKLHKKLGVKWLLVLLAAVLVLNVISNMARIFLLVYGKIMPDTIMHDVAGIVCFLLYCLLPTAFLTKKLVQHKGASLMASTPAVERGSSRRWVLPVLVLVAVVISGHQIACRQNRYVNLPVGDHYKNYQLTKLDGNVFKLKNANVLAYIKPIPTFYSGEHHPMFCWGGSGYALTHVAENEIEGLKFYSAILQKEKEALYTAWWYDNGSMHTIAQADWRLKMLRGENGFCLVNITAESRDVLEKQVLFFRHRVNINDFTLK